MVEHRLSSWLSYSVFSSNQESANRVPVSNFVAEKNSKHGGTLVYHLLQDLKVPGSKLDKDEKFLELEMMRDL